MKQQDIAHSPTVLITGASRGIGQQLAYQYAMFQCHLILIARDPQLLKITADKCEALGARTTCKAIDVRDAVALRTFIMDIDNTYPIDLCIANAGVSSTLQSHWQPEKDEDIENVLLTNVHGTFNTIQPLIKKMIARKQGQLAIVSSIAGFRGLPQSPSYSASKAAIRIYGQSLRAWLSRYDVKVNVICPGFVKTDMSDPLTGPKPFLLTSEQAAKKIKRGLEKNKPSITFPWQLNWMSQLAYISPSNLVDKVLNWFESHQ